MKRIFFIIIISFLLNPVSAQYYIRGDVKDEKNEPLQNVKIYMPATRSLYYSGHTGGFGIPSSNQYDSLIFSLDGYTTQSLKIKTDVYQGIVLKMIPATMTTHKPQLVSITSGKSGQILPSEYFQSESYSNLAENDFIKADDHYVTGFSMRIDKASYSNIRRFINLEMKVPPDAVRIDEMLNYFNFSYKEPPDNKVFSLESQVSDCPWDKDHLLLFLNLSARKLNLEHVPKSNLVFLIDVSGSMDQPNRLPLLKEAFQLLVKNLRQKDTVSIVTYGGDVGIRLKPTSGADKKTISKAIEELTAYGDTPGEAAIRTAYKLAESTFMKNGNNRIILATDGDFNIGQTTEKDLEELITKEKQSGVYLTCLGVGMGNYKDSKIEILSKKGNGNFAYIDDIREAEKVLVTEFTQTLYSVANDVFLNIKFNPELIKNYRLIGYDNKKNILAENGNELEGGEIGSASGNTVLFEITPLNKDSLANKNRNIADISLHYRMPGDTLGKNIKFSCPGNYISFDKLNNKLRFATAVAMFGLKLRQSKYFPVDTDWNVIKDIAVSSLTPDDYLETELIGLIDKSIPIYYEKKKRKRRQKK
ncbi:MAG: von Willebrand factor type A domain-containing protein [Bacteroidota bacterium]|nr:von Willebrand factor type A domain-containing protein [Bacteroidota bacterium]